jgi:FKBP-type peptidyl-prolyl cis-trans isomerase
MKKKLERELLQEDDNRPKTFALGNADVFRCWELAIPQLKKGAKARLSCPSDLAWGGAYT